MEYESDEEKTGEMITFAKRELGFCVTFDHILRSFFCFNSSFSESCCFHIFSLTDVGFCVFSSHQPFQQSP
jgi:hypothetical protein